MYLFKNYTLKDWVAFCEVFGMPLRLGKYQPGASEDDKRALMQALVAIGADAAGIFPDGTAIEFVNTEKTSSTDLYERLARYCDEQVSKAILGQTLTSDSGGGSYAQSKTHNDVRHDLTVADCKAIAATLRRDLIRPLVLYNFGEDKRIPYLRFDAEESEDLTQTATVIGTLIREAGLKVPTSYIYKKFSIPKPEGDEEVATPPGQTAQGAGSAPSPSRRSPASRSRLGRGRSGARDARARRPSGGSGHPEKRRAFKKAFGPVLKKIENAESLEELRDMMEDEKAVAELFGEMDVSEVEELLQKVMLYANLEGRAAEDGRH